METAPFGVDMDIEVMPEGFSPRRRGRKPTYDISEVLAALVDYKGEWVKFKLPPDQARSAQRQLSRMDFDVASELNGTLTTLYVRSRG